MDKGPWKTTKWKGKHIVVSDDFTHDVGLIINGDFESDAQIKKYAKFIASQLNKALEQGK